MRAIVGAPTTEPLRHFVQNNGLSVGRENVLLLHVEADLQARSKRYKQPTETRRPLAQLLVCELKIYPFCRQSRIVWSARVQAQCHVAYFDHAARGLRG